eukprot:s3867_g1.t1
MGSEKEPVGMSELGCADGCPRRGCKGVGGNGWEEEPLGMSELECADGCGRRGCEGVGGEGAAGDERARMRGRLRTAWVQGSGWKWVGRRSRWGMSELGCADGCGRCGCKGVGCGNGWGQGAAGDERAWMRGRLRTAWVQGSGWKWVVKRGRWVQGSGWKWVGRRSRWGMSELGCADGCGRRGCKGVGGGNGWGQGGRWG